MPASTPTWSPFSGYTRTQGAYLARNSFACPCGTMMSTLIITSKVLSRNCSTRWRYHSGLNGNGAEVTRMTFHRVEAGLRNGSPDDPREMFTLSCPEKTRRVFLSRSLHSRLLEGDGVTDVAKVLGQSSI